MSGQEPRGIFSPPPGLVPTGRQVRDVCSTLVELIDARGACFTAVVFDDNLIAHRALNLGVDLVAGFLEQPMVLGLVPLLRSERDEHGRRAFIYPTGPVWSVLEVMRRVRELGLRVGERAAVELMWLAAQILEEGAATGSLRGCFSHGDLRPSRITVRASGEVQIIGYGLPQVELLLHRAEPAWPVRAESLGYCPPERLEGQPEDASADVYSLAMLVLELIEGRPLFATHDAVLLARWITQSSVAEALARLKEVTGPVRDVLGQCLIYDPDARLGGPRLDRELHRLLAEEVRDDGGLAALVSRLRGADPGSATRARPLVSQGATGAFTRADLARALPPRADPGGESDEDAQATPRQAGERWRRPERSAGAAAAALTGKAPRATSDGDGAPLRRLRRGTDEGSIPPARSVGRLPESAPEPGPEPGPEPAPDVSEARPERRLRRHAPDSGDAAPAQESRERLRRARELRRQRAGAAAIPPPRDSDDE